MNRSPILSRTFISVAIILAAQLSSSHLALAQGKARVIVGQELLVSSIPSQTNSSPMLPPLISESGALSSSAIGDGSVRVVAIGTPPQSGPPKVVEADLVDLRKRCNQLIQRNPNVTMDCEPNLVRQLYAEPNDSYYSGMYNLRQIDAPTAWDISTSAKSVLVAIVDTGIDYGHIELADNMAVNTREIPFNRRDDDGNGFVDDYLGYDFGNKDSDPRDEDGHGTHVAGIIGAVANNDVGVAGIAWNASLLAVKVFDNNGIATTATVSAGIKYAVSRGAKVINLSLGGENPSSAEAKAIWLALQKDVVVVTAAGNDSRDLDQKPAYPVGYEFDNIISVAATTRGESLAAAYSNFGLKSVDVAAPGNDILSTIPNNYLEFRSGTSMAAPHVSGIAAVMRALNPMLSFAETKSLIMNTVDIRSTLLGKTLTGGRVDFARALKAAQGNLRNPPPPARIISIASSRTRSTAKISGTMLSRNRVPLADEWTTLVCNDKAFRKAKTRGAGYYEYTIALPAVGGYSCYVEDDRGSRSSRIVVG